MWSDKHHYQILYSAFYYNHTRVCDLSFPVLYDVPRYRFLFNANHLLKLLHERTTFLLLIDIWHYDIIQLRDALGRFETFRKNITVDQKRAFGGARAVYLLDNLTELHPAILSS